MISILFVLLLQQLKILRKMKCSLPFVNTLFRNNLQICKVLQ